MFKLDLEKVKEPEIKCQHPLNHRKSKREEKETHEAVAAASPVRMKPCTFWRNTFLSGIENAVFMWVQDLLC